MTADLFIAHVAGRYHCYWTPDGRDRQYIGPTHATPRAAIAYAAAATGTAHLAPEAPGTDTDGGPRSAEPVGGRQGPSDAIAPAMRPGQEDRSGPTIPLWGTLPGRPGSPAVPPFQHGGD